MSCFEKFETRTANLQIVTELVDFLILFPMLRVRVFCTLLCSFKSDNVRSHQSYKIPQTHSSSKGCVKSCSELGRSLDLPSRRVKCPAAYVLVHSTGKLTNVRVVYWGEKFWVILYIVSILRSEVEGFLPWA